MKENYNYLIEYKSVMQRAIDILGNNPSHGPDEEVKGTPSINLDDDDSTRAKDPLIMAGNEVALGHIAGTIHTDEQLRFKKLIFRATKGKAYVRFSEL